MDIAAIPRVNSIILTGLDFSMKPEDARFESSKGFIKPFHELKAMHLIKSLAVMVYNQEKMTPYFHNNVCDGRNSLAYFICAVHRQQAPQPMTKTHHRQDSASSNRSISSKSNTGKSSCPLDKPGENCDLPKLCTTSMLPLGYWDSLYYALVAEIRQLHRELTSQYGFAMELENPILHHQGPDGTTDQPITAIDLASMLETAWYALMDNRLVAALDDAVRMRNLRENAAQEEVNNAVRQFLGAIKKDKSDNTEPHNGVASLWPPPIVEGLVDVNALSPEAIVSLLWEKHAPEINRACLEDFEDEAMLTAYRAELHAKEVEAAIATSTPLPTASFCPCHYTCVCSWKCDEDTEKCTCMNGRAQIYHLIHQQESRKHEIHTKYVKPDQNVPNQFLGAATNTLAQMQIAAVANPDPVIVQACYNIHEANNERERHVANRNRQRANTNDNDLAYVPSPNTPNRGPKDVYPLNFYGSISPQRYPRMPPHMSTFNSTQGQSATGTSFYHGNVPTGKPVPPPITTSTNPYGPFNSQPAGRNQPLTPPSSGSYNTQTFTEAGQVKYPPIPVSQSESIFTQSFPVTSSGDPRDINYKSTTSQKAMETDCGDPAQDYISLLARHPSTIEYGEQAAEPFPRLSRRATASPPKRVATTNALPTLKTLDAVKEKPQPLLPQPDFIAPRPAVKQRYVSAGGTAKLSERLEIQGPAFTTPAAPTGGMISKEEVDAKMSDPEWVRRHFGEAALGVTGSLSASRPSGDSNKRTSKRNSTRNSGRNSDESDRTKGGDKRDRTSSGASGRVAKLKRVFSSHKNSGSDND